MVSKNARDRFLRWQDDLQRAESKAKETKTSPDSSPSNLSCVPCQYDTASAADNPRPLPRDHVAAVMAGTWNEGQPDSPYHTPGSDPVGSLDLEASTTPGYFHVVGSPGPGISRPPARTHPEKLPLYSTIAKRNTRPGHVPPSLLRPPLKSPDSSSRNARKDEEKRNPDQKHDTDSHQKFHEHLPDRDGSMSPHASNETPGSSQFPSQASSDARGIKRPADPSETSPVSNRERLRPFHINSDDEDLITDTIGAIAVDENGHMAAGSSSGGIGMKHRGRLGPAALVGVGTAIVPCDENDEDQVSVGAVTSGTGEHMATTMASQRCAERIYHGTRRGRGGSDIQDDDEDAIMESFIMDDFMNHPGVKNCHSAGAIGVMVVKKCRTGYYFYFAHNTDSFALASMGGSEREPRCTMSRLPDGAKIAKGGRKVWLD
ncbi:nucleophile aminohydrolase [Mariannaea sp. PMI_226]|nr:nucleophile aminohydrolase [Mariannaea sp. PMI_226]